MADKVIFDPVKKIWQGPKMENYRFGTKSVGEVVHETMLSDLNHVCQVIQIDPELDSIFDGIPEFIIR